jgi:hypothetical protein
VLPRVLPLVLPLVEWLPVLALPRVGLRPPPELPPVLVPLRLPVVELPA